MNTLPLHRRPGVSAVAYAAAKKKAQRNKDMMAALFSEWGKIMATATSYERAHFFDNVGVEVRGSAMHNRCTHVALPHWCTRSMR